MARHDPPQPTPVPPRDNRPRQKPRFSIWTILAPIALIALVLITWTAIGQVSLSGNGDGDLSEADKIEQQLAAEEAERSRLRDARPNSVKVKPGESLALIAEEYGLDESELIDFNPQINDPQTLSPGQIVYLRSADERRGGSSSNAAETDGDGGDDASLDQ